MEKKKLAMAMREKQLGALGMQVLVFSLLYDIHYFSFEVGKLRGSSDNILQLILITCLLENVLVLYGEIICFPEFSVSF